MGMGGSRLIAKRRHRPRSRRARAFGDAVGNGAGHAADAGCFGDGVGNGQSAENISVGTQASGTIASINVDYNSKVRKGQVLARIDPSSFQAQLDASAGRTRASAGASRRRPRRAPTAPSSVIGVAGANANRQVGRNRGREGQHRQDASRADLARKTAATRRRAARAGLHRAEHASIPIAPTSRKMRAT